MSSVERYKLKRDFSNAIKRAKKSYKNALKNPDISQKRADGILKTALNRNIKWVFKKQRLRRNSLLAEQNLKQSMGMDYAFQTNPEIATIALDEVQVYGSNRLDTGSFRTRPIMQFNTQLPTAEELTVTDLIPHYGQSMFRQYDPNNIGKGPFIHQWANSENLVSNFTYGLVNDAFQVLQIVDFDLIPGKTNPLTGKRTNINLDGSANYHSVDGFVNTLTLAAPYARGTKFATSTMPRGYGYLNKLNAAQFSKLFKGNLSKLAPQWRGLTNRMLNKVINTYNENISTGLFGLKAKSLKELLEEDAEIDTYTH